MQQGQSGKTYLNETKGFLDYITATMQSVDEFVREVVDNPPESELIKIKLKDFGVIKKSLSWLYGWVKEAVYADSLSIPFSLATFLNQTGKKLKKSRNVSLVVLGSPDLMYYKYNLRPLRDVTKNLADRIKDCQPLSKDLGILMFPYCAAREVLANCVLFHEMGHYLYESTELQGEIYEFVKAALSQFIKSEKVMDKLSMPLGAGRSLLNYVSHLMLNWADEIFADIFAISILGPAFHLA